MAPLREVLQARTRSYTFVHPLLGTEGGLLRSGGCFLFERGGLCSPGDSHRPASQITVPRILRVYRNCTSRLIKVRHTLSPLLRVIMIRSY